MTYLTFVPSAFGAPSSFSRTTVVPLDRYHRETRIVRERSINKEHVRFSAQGRPLDGQAMVIFEILSESETRSVLRWRCVAKHHTDECFTHPIRVRYLPDDTRVIMTVRVTPSPPS
ncbi:MAG: hypothetical protein AAFV29_01465 [Myxococcota bacterium]